MKDQQNYKFSSSFRSIHEARKNQTQSYIQSLQGRPDQQRPIKSGRKKSKDNEDKPSAHHPNLFKLNPTSTAMVSQVPVQMIRNRSKSKLESLAEPSSQAANKRFSIFDHQKPADSSQNMVKKDKRQFLKKYNIDLGAAFDTQLKKKLEEQVMDEEQEQHEGFLKPSQPYEIPSSDKLYQHTIFQTPLLPCFASEFTPDNPIMANGIQAGLQPESKQIREGEGVWKIGKIKIKGKKATMKVGNIDFQGKMISAEGKSGCVSGDRLYELNDWKGVWIMQPKDDLFL